uniref:DUF1618 domain-containing protein n=1 Tax=Aegilops tauschii TaxID=37682 RepID=R7W351_AEGTA
MVLPGSAAAGWMMLDRFIYHRGADGDCDGWRFPDESTAPLRATSSTSIGEPFDVAILHAEPPAVSRLYLRWPGGTNTRGAELAAAHRDLLLFRNAYHLLSRVTYHHRPRYRERGFLEVNRSICVTGGGDLLKYTSVVRTDGRLCGPLEHRQGYNIITDVLKATESVDMEWDRVTFVTAYEFWRHNTSELLPRDAVPEYPLVSMDDPSIIHFLLSEEREKINKVSVVTMDMVTNKMISVVPYIKGEEDLDGEDADMGLLNIQKLEDSVQLGVNSMVRLLYYVLLWRIEWRGVNPSDDHMDLVRRWYGVC